MKKFLLPLIVGMCVFAFSPHAQAQSDDFSLSVGLNQDVFFGFYPTFAGSKNLGGNTDFTFYGIFWTIPAFGPGAGGGGLWTEFGAGVNFNTAGGLSINPQLGFTHGALLSSYTAGPATAFDGIVPNLTVGLDTDILEGEFYGGYYAALRSVATTTDYLHYWLNVGAKASPFVSLGAHYEQLVQTRLSEGEAANTIYQWVGPYIQFSLPNQHTVRFSGGWDTADSDINSFYKLSLNLNF